MKKLRDVLPYEFFVSGFDFCKHANKFLDINVIEKIDGRLTAWPGTHKNVLIWWKLDNGWAIGWNENPSIGWSFPAVKISKK